MVAANNERIRNPDPGKWYGSERVGIRTTVQVHIFEVHTQMSSPFLPVKTARVEGVGPLAEGQTGNDVTMAPEDVVSRHGLRLPDVDQLVLVPTRQVLVVRAHSWRQIETKF